MYGEHLKHAIDPQAVLPLGAATFHILLALADGERHGYAIAKDVEVETGGAIVIRPGTLYRVIKQLLTDGWIAEVPTEIEDVRRRTYRLTPRGRAVAQAEARRLDALITIARSRRLLPALGPARTP